jgi:hypothetical protein
LALGVALLITMIAGALAAEDCSKLECKDTQYGYLNAKAQLDPETGKCACLPFFNKESPCYNMHCKAAFLAVEENGKCSCINPCGGGLHCDPPFVLEPDYTRSDPEKGYCKCVKPMEIHYPLPKYQAELGHGFEVKAESLRTYMARPHRPSECADYTCDTKFGVLKYWAEQVDGKCQCLPVYPDGPCKGHTCPDGYLVLEKGDKCTCTNPCQGMLCDPPMSPVIDYIRETQTLCKCALLKVKKTEL